MLCSRLWYKSCCWYVYYWLFVSIHIQARCLCSHFHCDNSLDGKCMEPMNTNMRSEHCKIMHSPRGSHVTLTPQWAIHQWPAYILKVKDWGVLSSSCLCIIACQLYVKWQLYYNLPLCMNEGDLKNVLCYCHKQMNQHIFTKCRFHQTVTSFATAYLKIIKLPFEYSVTVLSFGLGQDVEQTEMLWEDGQRCLWTLLSGVHCYQTASKLLQTCVHDEKRVFQMNLVWSNQPRPLKCFSLLTVSWSFVSPFSGRRVISFSQVVSVRCYTLGIYLSCTLFLISIAFN